MPIIFDWFVRKMTEKITSLFSFIDLCRANKNARNEKVNDKKIMFLNAKHVSDKPLWLAGGASLFLLGGAAQAIAECNPFLQSQETLQRYEAMDHVVLDRVTNLIWERCPVGYRWETSSCSRIEGFPVQFSWEAALQYAFTRPAGWRLPNPKELESLIKRNCYSPALDTAAFSDLPLGFHWTSAARPQDVKTAWAVDLNSGAVSAIDKTQQLLIRLVKENPSVLVSNP